eukprot:706921-Rhodomonas_salina.2
MKAELAKKHAQEAAMSFVDSNVARLCDFVYLHNAEDFRQKLRNSKFNFDIVDYGQGSPGFAILFDKHARLAVVVFRGTRDIWDVVADASAKPSVHDATSDCKPTLNARLVLHSGVGAMLHGCYNGSRGNDGESFKLCKLQEVIFSKLCHLTNIHGQVYRLIYAGHSLGGALALACRAFHSQRKFIDFGQIETLTFGAPLVFCKGTDADVLADVEATARNYVNGSDIVPRILRFNSSHLRADQLCRYMEEFVREKMGFMQMTISAFTAIWTWLGHSGKVKKLVSEILQNSKSFTEVGRTIPVGGASSESKLHMLPRKAMTQAIEDHKMEKYIRNVFDLESNSKKRLV